MFKVKKQPGRQEQSQSQQPQPQPPQSQAKPPLPERRAEDQSSREDEIRPLAFQKWQEAGCPAGEGVEFWLAAENEILRRKPR